MNARSTRRHGAEPILFMSWAYQDAPEMTATLADAYKKGWRCHQMRVVPAGLAFARSIAKRPELNLMCPTSGIQAWPALTWPRPRSMRRFTGEAPVGKPISRGTIDEPTASFLQTVAWETVQDYFREGNRPAPAGLPCTERTKRWRLAYTDIRRRRAQQGGPAT